VWIRGEGIGTTVAHYLPRLYPNPEVFDPARFFPPRNEHRQAGAYAPYGQGAHICLGAGLAETQIVLTVAALVHAFKLRLYPPDYKLKVAMAPTLVPDKRFQMVPETRRH